jgi:hypothetical protein
LKKIMSDKLESIVGSENVLDSPELIDKYSKDISFVNPIRPRCIVTPKTRDEVVEIVKWANKTLTPLIPVSSGFPKFRGDTIPSVGGAVIIDLSKMKKIIRVDRRNKVAILEPGVTYDELIQALTKEDLAPLMPLMPRRTKSVVAGVLETEPITTPKYHWDTQDPLLCAEVVFGNGDLFRTGDAAGPGDLEDQWRVGRAQTKGIGPSFVDFSKLLQRAQGTIGIVTWASIWCRPLPKAREAFFVPSQKLNPLIELTYKLLWRRLGDIYIILNRCNLACIIGERAIKGYDNFPKWVLLFTIEPSGVLCDKKLDFYRAEFIRWAQSFGLRPLDSVLGVSAEDVAKLVSGVSPEPYWKLRLKGGVQELFFISTLDRVPEFIKKFAEVAAFNGYPLKEIGVYVQPLVQGANCHCEFDLYYDPDNIEEVEIVKRVFNEGARLLLRSGAFFARPYGPLRDIMMPYVSAPFVILQRKIKMLFDPNNVMNPGKLFFT